jgi:hypothetical protein
MLLQKIVRHAKVENCLKQVSTISRILHCSGPISQNNRLIQTKVFKFT